jgi:hypothetical protein
MCTVQESRQTEEHSHVQDLFLTTSIWFTTSQHNPLCENTMSDLYRSSMQARIAKLPDLALLGIEDNDEDEEEEEENDNLSALPGSGLGPPAM